MAIRKYIDKLISILNVLDEDIIESILEVIKEAREQGNHIYIIGNGGSGTNASHIAGDLTKSTIKQGLISSTTLDNNYLVTAWSNDTGYENVFYNQLRGKLNQGDVLIALSGSGESANIIMALTYAKQCKAKTISLTGFSGGLVKEISDICLIVPSECMEQIEDIHLIIGHILTVELK